MCVCNCAATSISMLDFTVSMAALWAFFASNLILFFFVVACTFLVSCVVVIARQICMLTCVSYTFRTPFTNRHSYNFTVIPLSVIVVVYSVL